MQSATIAAQLTSPGRGAVAVIGLHGPAAESTLQQHFRPAQGKPFSQIQNRKIVYGVWRSTGEDLIVSRRAADHFEVHCHGGDSACLAIFQSFTSSNVRQVSPAVFARAFKDPWTVSAELALTEAATAKTAKLLLDQVRILPAAIKQIKLLIQSGDAETTIAKIEQMLQWSDFGRHLTLPRSIVLCGQPNVGKSSLANAMIGFQRAIVHDMAGTTRDVVSQSTAIDGWPVELKDTAGLRVATSSIEAIGVEKAKAQIESADLKIGVFDLSLCWTAEDQTLLNSIDPHLIVFNKCDLANERQSQSDRPAGLETSVPTGEGIASMIEKIGQLLVPSLPDPTQPIPVTPSQRRRLIDIAARLKNHQPIDSAEIDDLSFDTDVHDDSVFH